jgi:hypothetical protein
MAISGVVNSWASSDSLEASQWVSALPAGRQRDAAAAALVDTIAAADPGSAWTWATSIVSPELRQRGLSAAYRAALDDDPASAARLLNDPALDDTEFAALAALAERASPGKP